MPRAPKATLQLLGEVLASADFSPAEKLIISCQFPDFIRLGSWEMAFWQALCAADGVNLKKLACGFPTEVEALECWRHGNLGERIRAAGLSV
jgi:hypothetical protein